MRSRSSQSSAASAKAFPDGLPLPRRRYAYSAIIIVIAMAVLDGSIANTALPTIARELHVSAAASVWVVNGFQLAVVASIFTFAGLGNAFGPSRIYRLGVIAFIIGSLLCAVSRSLPLLIAMRVVQGLGAAGIMSLAPAILREIFPRAELGSALGLNAFVVATSSAAGPTIGGAILAIAPWPWLFGVNVPLGIVALILGARSLPTHERQGNGIDALSSIVSAIAFCAFIYGLDGVARHESPALVALELAVAVIASVVFIRRQPRLERPLLATAIFKNPTFSLAAATSTATFTAQGLAYVSLPFFFQSALGMNPFGSGLLLTSWPLAIALVAPIAGRLSDRYPAAILATAGLAVLTIGLGLYATLTAHATILAIIVHGAICGLGFGFFQSPNNRELMGSAPRSKSTSASAVLASARVGGQTTGAAVVAIVFGAFGASIATHSGHAALAREVAAATPITLWIACAASGIATIASGLRLRKSAPQAAVEPSA